MAAEPLVSDFLYLASMKARFSLSLLAIFALLISVSSCVKPDDEVNGCVYGKTAYAPSEYKLGCMTKAEFNRYIQNPGGSVQGEFINKDLRFVKVEDCVRCR